MYLNTNSLEVDNYYTNTIPHHTNQSSSLEKRKNLANKIHKIPIPKTNCKNGITKTKIKSTMKAMDFNLIDNEGNKDNPNSFKEHLTTWKGTGNKFNTLIKPTNYFINEDINRIKNSNKREGINSARHNKKLSMDANIRSNKDNILYNLQSIRTNTFQFNANKESRYNSHGNLFTEAYSPRNKYTLINCSSARNSLSKDKSKGNKIEMETIPKGHKKEHSQFNIRSLRTDNLKLPSKSSRPLNLFSFDLRTKSNTMNKISKITSGPVIKEKLKDTYFHISKPSLNSVDLNINLHTMPGQCAIYKTNVFKSKLEHNENNNFESIAKPAEYFNFHQTTATSKEKKEKSQKEEIDISKMIKNFKLSTGKRFKDRLDINKILKKDPKCNLNAIKKNFERLNTIINKKKRPVNDNILLKEEDFIDLEEKIEMCENEIKTTQNNTDNSHSKHTHDFVDDEFEQNLMNDDFSNVIFKE
ncbi:MAG: hypothetical protein MJ252_01620 [archaeon]|nr:hypothetical protein [archaeon]